MNVNSDRRSSTFASRQPSTPEARASRALRAGSRLSILGLATAAGIACGSAEDGSDDGVPGFMGFGGSTSGVGGTASSLPGAGGSGTPACTPGAVGCSAAGSEGVPPNIPVNQAGSSAVGSTACTPNTATCAGTLLNRCDGAGLPVAPQDCAATGGTCSVVNGVASCVAPSCTPGVASCSTANIVSTCGADGTITTTRCPDGTNCTGAGQCTPVACNPAGMLSTNNGGVTVYWFNQGTYSDVRQPDEDVNCSFGSDGSQTDTGQQDRVFNIPDERMFGAINGVDYNNAATCGACVELTNPQNGRTVNITVVDSCVVENNNPTCTQGHIDLSRAAFEQLTNQSTGDINNISWRFVPCAGDTGVQFQLKKPDDPYWNQFVVLNHRYPIVRAEVLMEDNRWVDARRESYNYWLPPEGAGGEGGDMGTYRVRVTDVNGAIIEEQLELRGGLQGGNGQFDCQ